MLSPNRGPFWEQDKFDETDCSFRTITKSVCGQYIVTGTASKLGGVNSYSDRYVAEHRSERGVLWFSLHRSERAAFKAIEKRKRAVKRGLKKPRVARTKSEMKIVRKKN
jgi:hypothetical protein